MDTKLNIYIYTQNFIQYNKKGYLNLSQECTICSTSYFTIHEPTGRWWCCCWCREEWLRLEEDDDLRLFAPPPESEGLAAELWISSSLLLSESVIFCDKGLYIFCISPTGILHWTTRNHYKVKSIILFSP